MAGSTCSTFRRSMPRLPSLPMTISRRPRRRDASSAVSVIFSFSTRISAVDPLKSNRVASSLRAWLTALSISCASTSETMSNEGMLGIFEFRFSIFDWFRARRQARVVAAGFIVLALFVFPGCDRAAKKEEKALRAELRKAIDQQAYERAVELARKHLTLRPQDNGTWDRLIRAQLGLQDLAGVSQSLDDWRNTVPEPSLKLDEYAGDYAAAKKDDAWAVAAWKRVADADPKNVRVWEKIARLEKRRHF